MTRNEETRFEAVLRQHAADIQKADEKALRELGRLGFGFADMTRAKAYQTKMQRARRANAELIAATAAVRKTA